MSTRIYGIASAQIPDTVQETVNIKNLDLSNCTYIRDEHDTLDFFRLIGGITKTRKIFSEKDIEDDKQRRCWESVGGVPFAYIEAVLADGKEAHPNAMSAAAFIRFCQRPDSMVHPGFSLDGGITQRSGKEIIGSFATSVALTVKPCNKACKVFLENDLQKSEPNAPVPQRYIEALAKSQSLSSFNIIPKANLIFKVQSLKKSIADYAGAMTHVKCFRCGTPTRFFKSSNDLPNNCPKCGNSFSMAQLWKAMKE